ncbi:MAG TPA: hypothetical protein VGE66_02510 [Chitinophagaceae bacterium]
MLEELLPVLKPHKPTAHVTTEPEMVHTLPGVESRISFEPLLHYLKEKQSAISDIRAGFYNYLLEKFEAEPDLAGIIEDPARLEKHSELLELLSTMLFPVVSRAGDNSFAFTAPYKFRSFYCSDSFSRLFLDEQGEHLKLPEGMTAEQLKNVQCSMIYDHVLEQFYGIKLNDMPELLYPVMDEKTGLKRFYRICYDRRFIQIKLKGQLPSLENCAVCLNTFRILDLEKQLETMPLELFEVEGFAVWVAEDVTANESLENIKKILIRQDECDTEIIHELRECIHTLVGISDVSIGMMSFIKLNDKYVIADECVANSLIGHQFTSRNPDTRLAFQVYLGLLQEHPYPLPVTHLDEKILGDIPFLRPLHDKGYRSYLHYPMLNSDGLLGILEVASHIPDTLDNNVVTRLEPAIPLLSVAMLKNRNTIHNRIDRYIKEKFTALQRSVEWKFSEVAWEQLFNHDGEEAEVVFEDVYPLYGAIDIRNSSQERSNAIQKDLKCHLQLINDTLEVLEAKLALPLLEGLKFKNDVLLHSIQESMLAEDEMRINEFIEEEVESVFGHLQASSVVAADAMHHYYAKVREEKRALQTNRLEYEQAVATINEAIQGYLEGEEKILQHSYPHYFEHYRTDGIEYNIYIGQSIAPTRSFDLLYLKNIRLWQLKSMAEVARVTHQLLPSLKVPLQTTQLILIHSHCLSIAFRTDERRFDVEGSYNIRYEIIKKRLDKALIKGTEERLTQPGKIALVYSNTREQQEYQQYIEFLQNKGVLAPGLELLELEDMQGVKGLKAMRVEIVL